MTQESIKYGLSPYRENKKYVDAIGYFMLFLSISGLILAANV